MQVYNADDEPIACWMNAHASGAFICVFTSIPIIEEKEKTYSGEDGTSTA